MLKNDWWIRHNATQNNLIHPFQPSMVREVFLQDAQTPVDKKRVLSYGLSSYGYDLRLSPKDFRVFRRVAGSVVDPKRFNPDYLEKAKLHKGENEDEFFILPAHSYGLGVAVEHLQMPPNITAICLGKSTYARCGIIANCTPAESRWRGYLTLEFSNASDSDCRIYANEGVVQLLFFEGESPMTTYADRLGKYQDQEEEVTLAKV